MLMQHQRTPVAKVPKLIMLTDMIGRQALRGGYAWDSSAICGRPGADAWRLLRPSLGNRGLSLLHITLRGVGEDN